MIETFDFITSDSHFGHAKILEYGRKGFINVDEMDRTIIKNWNDTVGPDDVVIHLGDFCLGQKERAPEYFHALNGRKYLLLGNHDNQATIDLFTGASSTPDRYLGEMYTLRGKKKNGIVLSHYALEVWRNSQYGSWMLHGHSHDGLNTRPNAKRLDVGIDAAIRLLGIARPFSFEEVKAIMVTRNELSSQDHHKEKQ